MDQRELFLRHVGQTSPAPVGLEVERAEGVFLYDPAGRRYYDLISGVSVSNVGHCHPRVVEAVRQQAGRYMHLMVYGEYIQTPQVALAERLAKILPGPIDSVYYVNSGSEAIEGAVKLAKRHTGRPNLVGCRGAYHGGTHGALSLMGGESLKDRFRPLLPGVRQIAMDDEASLRAIDHTTACAVVEPIQGEAGIVVPSDTFMRALRQRCDQTGTLLIFDEIQTGFGRTGTMFACESFGVEPDIICLAKALGGGMPLGAFAAPQRLMNDLTHSPALGHITTFGGHPVSCAASLAMLEVMESERLVESVARKERLFRERLRHPAITRVWGRGLFLGVELRADLDLYQLLPAAVRRGVLLDPFLFRPQAFRIAPPLTITQDQIDEACGWISLALDDLCAAAARG